MLKGFGIIALFLAAEAAFLLHAALPSGIPASSPRGAVAAPSPQAAVRPCAGTTRC
jgi:hypothetical protein